MILFRSILQNVHQLETQDSLDQPWFVAAPPNPLSIRMKNWRDPFHHR
jgi:hypothetical protein